MLFNDDTICAIATPAGVGAIAVIRISGGDAIALADKLFVAKAKQKKLVQQKPNTIHFGYLKEGETVVDEVLVSLFKMPFSYTGEDTVEISCHGSQFVQQLILQLLIKKGARMAQPGEFTMRAFMNGKLDLLQAEAVAELISSSSEASHKVAIHQMRGGFSTEIKQLREQLLNFISLIELELDFSEEEVEFANRTELLVLIQKIDKIISKLIKSFQLGNVIKNGIPVAIIGEPNVGKSTLLNVLLKEEKAIVSEIAGTTRDAIEDTFNLQGITFRFIDTAGLRETTDIIENLGIERTHQKIEHASIILLMIDAENYTSAIRFQAESFREKYPDKKVVVVVNKVDKMEIVPDEYQDSTNEIPIVFISAKHHQNIEKLEKVLLSAIDMSLSQSNEVIITNARHFEALTRTGESISRVLQGFATHIPSDLLAQDIREALHYLGEITGEITTDEVLGNIFKNFCIGK